MKIIEILKKENYKIEKRVNHLWTECPICMSGITAKIEHNKIKCINCGEEYSHLDALGYIYPDKTERELKELLKDRRERKINIKYWIDFYQKYDFSLVPVSNSVNNNGKAPIEKDWQKKIHKDPSEWRRWLSIGMNIGVKCGKDSNVMVIDIDGDVPEIFRPYLLKTLTQKTPKGFHLFFKYCEEINKTSFNYKGTHIDIEAEGGQVVVAPSLTYDNEANLKEREFINQNEIIELPQELKDLIQEQSQFKVPTFSEQLVEHINTEDFNLNVVKEGEGRNNFILHLGGMLRKRFGINDVEYVARLINNHFFSPPLPEKEIRHILKNLSRYDNFDDQEMAQKILNYIKMVEECTKKDIQDAMHENKGERIDRILTYLIKEGYIIRKGRYYKVLQKGQWKTNLIELTTPVPFDVPYFGDIANFAWGDMLLIASKSGFGKTVIAMNIVKRLVDQGIKPYYISLEAGSRFSITALKLGLRDGDFYWDFVPDPTKIELEQNSVTVIDWLLVRDKAKTDLVFEYLVEQCFKSNSFVVVFQQLKDSGEYFAPNLVQQFPAFACKFLYKKEDERADAYFKITKVRDAKSQFYPTELPTIYNWETREVKRIEEVVEEPF